MVENEATEGGLGVEVTGNLSQDKNSMFSLYSLFSTVVFDFVSTKELYMREFFWPNISYLVSTKEILF